MVVIMVASEALTARGRHLVLCPDPAECADHPENLTAAEWSEIRPEWGAGSWPSTARYTAERAAMAMYGPAWCWVAEARGDRWGGPMYCGPAGDHSHPTEAEAFNCAASKSNPAEWRTRPIWPIPRPPLRPEWEGRPTDRKDAL